MSPSGPFRTALVSTIEYETIDETETILDLSATINAGVQPRARKLWEPWPGIPMNALPPIDFSEQTDIKGKDNVEKKPRFTIPKFKVGLLFEVPLILQFKVELEKKLGSQAKFP